MMLDAALQWASKGFAVFPCVPLGKEPATTNGHKDATTDEATIRAWWSQNPNYNIGVSPGHSGMFVLDTDPPRGEETLASLELEHGLVPTTLTFRSPRGGFHRWFRGRCASSVGTEKAGLGPKLDTRGYGGYVLLPPSRVRYPDGSEGDYQCTDDQEIANGPVWISEVLQSRREQHKAADVALDLPANIERARNLVERYRAAGDVAIEGSGGDRRTYELACELLNLGLTPATAFNVIRDWNADCIPPWEEEELAVKIHNAAEYSQNEAGAWAITDGATTFAEYVASAVQEVEPGKRSRFYPYELTDVEAFEPPEWLIPDLIPKQGTVQITGPQKSFKTFLTLDIVLSIATGTQWCGVKPDATGLVIYIAGENASALALKHVPSWCTANDQEPALLDFRVVREMPHAAFADEMIEFVAAIKAENLAPTVVVIDTATRALRGLDENNARDMGQFSAACEMIQRELTCTVIVIRHTGKDVSRGGRGSNVIEGDFDTILAVERQLDQQERKTMFCTLTVQDQRNAAEREEPFAFEMTPLGQSLIPRQMSAKEHADATKQEDPFSRQRIGAALSKLGASTQERGIRTYALAMELTPALASDSLAAHDAAIRRVEGILKRRAKQSLAGYCAGEGRDMVWFAIAPEAE